MIKLFNADDSIRIDDLNQNILLIPELEKRKGKEISHSDLHSILQKYSIFCVDELQQLN